MVLRASKAMCKEECRQQAQKAKTQREQLVPSPSIKERFLSMAFTASLLRAMQQPKPVEEGARDDQVLCRRPAGVWGKESTKQALWSAVTTSKGIATRRPCGTRPASSPPRYDADDMMLQNNIKLC